MSDRPTISVLFPIYNGSRYLHEAMKSILAQTFEDFEVIAIDDGSSDDSADIVRSFDDPRIRLIQQENRGLPGTLNRAMELSQGKYFARQDQDDLALPERFAQQFAYLETHPTVYLLGTWAEIWEEDKPTERVHAHATTPVELAFALLFDNPFVHSSVMLRADVLKKVGQYTSDKSRQPEDFEFWSRISRSHGVANLGQPLQVYRETSGSMCRTGVHPYRDRVIRLSAENLADARGFASPDDIDQTLAHLAHNVPAPLGKQFTSSQLVQAVTVAAANLEKRWGAEAGVLAGAVESRCRGIVENHQRHHSLKSWLIPAKKLVGRLLGHPVL